MAIQSNKLNTMVDYLILRAETAPDMVAFTFLKDGDKESETITFAQLHKRATIIAARLQQIKIDNPTALLLYPQGIEHMCALWGCMYAGVRAVPLFIPQNDRVYRRIKSIRDDCGAQLVLSDLEHYEKMKKRLDRMPEISELSWILSDKLDDQLGADWKFVEQNGDTIAYYQYTSGSTGMPKGVMVSHGNLIYNLSDIDASWGHDEHTVLVSWLPIFHDMGLIYGFLQGIYNGFHTVLFSPSAFAQRPYTWLKAITDYKATHSGGPNSAFIMCVEKITEEQKPSLDLSSLKIMFNGSEPVRKSTLEAFTHAFAEQGFVKEMHTPCYGLAEGTLKVTATKPGEYPNQIELSASELEKNKVCLARGDEKSQVFVSCGETVQQTEVKIVDPLTMEECSSENVGEIWVKGPTNAKGYYRKVEDTDAIFNAFIANTEDGPYMRTGDLGLKHNNELYIAGRLKDLIIIRGKNCYPQDIEEAVERCHPALAPSAGAAFSVDLEGEEQLVIVHCLRRTHFKTVDAGKVYQEIRRCVSSQFGLKVHSIVLLKPASVPRTTSGKIQRSACKKSFLENTLEVSSQWSLETARVSYG